MEGKVKCRKRRGSGGRAEEVEEEGRKRKWRKMER